MKYLTRATITTPLGQMTAIADDKVLYSIEFSDRDVLEQEIERLKQVTNSEICVGKTRIIEQAEKEIEHYFAGKLKEFTVPLSMHGTSFQNQIWQELQSIPFGSTLSYSQIASKVQKPRAFRAVGTAIGNNCHEIIIPCHRVLNLNGGLGGYRAGLDRKKWLLAHEKTL